MAGLVPQLPAGAWDSHVHVIDEEQFPFAPDHPYRPSKATLSDLLAFEDTLGVDRVCLIACSVYGTDNRSILDALKGLDGKGRAVVSIDPAIITDEELQDMHQAGVRGVRLNLKTFNTTGTQQWMENLLQSYADRIRPLGWLIQLYLGLEQVVLLHQCLSKLQVPIAIDHMASPDPNTPAKEQPGYRELLDLLQRNLVWVKISGVYRFPRLPDLDGYGRLLIRTNSARVVWASDWPHTGGTAYNVNGDRHKLQSFRKVDDRAFIERCFDWCDNDPELVQKLFVRNPQALWTAGDLGILPRL